MAKIEELTELLVNEINSFEKSIERLEKASERINTTKIGIDITGYNSILESHQQKWHHILELLNGLKTTLKIN